MIYPIGQDGRFTPSAAIFRLMRRLTAVVWLSIASLLVAVAAQVVWQSDIPIRSPLAPSGQAFKRFQLLYGQEPVDALESFRVAHAQDRVWRDQILRQICNQHNQLQCSRDRAVVFSTQINSPDGAPMDVLKIFEDEEPADVLLEFARRNQIKDDQRQVLLDTVCQRPTVRCSRRQALLYRQLISAEDQVEIGTLDIYEYIEPIDQIHRFVIDHELPERVTDQLMQRVCQQAACHRNVPLVYNREVALNAHQVLGALQILASDEPVDVIYAFGLQHGLEKSYRQNLAQRVCAEKYVTCNRMAPIVFAAPIMDPNGTRVGVLEITEDQELADAVYEFAQKTNITIEYRHSLLRTLCGRQGILCTRGYARLRALPISDGSGAHLGLLEVFEGQEPADVVYDFVQTHGLSAQDRSNLIDELCTPDPRKPQDVKLVCTRYSPVVFAVPVSAQNGSTLGDLHVLAEDEPADAIARFGNKHGLTTEQKQVLWKGVCEASGLPCTRSRGLVYVGYYTLPDGRRERLDFMDGDEPTDLIYEYGSMRDLSLRQRKLFMIEVCNEPRRRPNCTRAEPMLLKIPVWESAEKKLGDLEILEGQEPIDMVYAFLEKHDLFQTEPLNTTLLEVVCNSTRVVCERTKPRRILFTMQATYAGIQHTLQYVRPESDWSCSSHQGGQTCVHYVEVLAKQFCETHMFDWSGCEPRILEALRNQLEHYEVAMWRGKDLYAQLGLVKTAASEEIDAAYNRLVKRFNNETEPQKYEKLQKAYRTLSDPEEKYFYDLPCMKIFGLCGKKQRDGGISISAD